MSPLGKLLAAAATTLCLGNCVYVPPVAGPRYGYPVDDRPYLYDDPIYGYDYRAGRPYDGGPAPRYRGRNRGQDRWRYQDEDYSDGSERRSGQNRNRNRQQDFDREDYPEEDVDETDSRYLPDEKAYGGKGKSNRDGEAATNNQSDSGSPSLAPKPSTSKEDILTGTRINADRVKSPYAPYKELDVSGMRSGSLAKDPTSGRVFRIP